MEATITLATAQITQAATLAVAMRAGATDKAIVRAGDRNNVRNEDEEGAREV